MNVSTFAYHYNLSPSRFLSTLSTRLVPIRPRAHASPTSVAMLGRARDKAQANKASSTSAATSSFAKPDLAHQLFPSSSPSAHDGNIAQWATSSKGRGGASFVSSLAHGPLRPRPNNVQLPSGKSSSVTESGASYLMPHTNNLASICSNVGSFQEDVGTSQSQSQGKNTVPVYFAEGDFSDDDTLELDYECPTALPSMPPPPPAPVPAPQAAPPTSQIPWSSSPQDHLYPPARSLARSLKRDSPDGNPPPAQPKTKKRTLPSTWKLEKEKEEEKEEEEEEGKEARSKAKKSLATPAPKKTAPFWDATQSATKDLKKQLKAQSKKSDSASGQGADFGQSNSGNSHSNSHGNGPSRPGVEAISLSSEQLHVLDLVIQKKQSVFFTGPAGTGKSVLMRAIIAELKKKWSRDPERLSVTASTGLAACNIGGQTLHSFAGIGLGKEDVPSLVRKIRRNPKAKNRWLRTSVLVIDEVSMVDGELFDKLAQIARTIRNNGRPWGGIQLVITGDFFQLPPVPDGGKKETKFAFDAATWNTSIDHTIGLTQVFRQKDSHFANMLSEMRLGRISEDTVRTFKSLSRELKFDDGFEVTELFPTRNEVERSNDFRLRNLPGEVHRYESADSGEPNVRDKLLSNMMAPKTIDLKKGAQVMLIKNMDETLVNGSLGKVIGFMNEATFEMWNSCDKIGSDDEAEVDAHSKKIKSFGRPSESSMKDSKLYPLVRFTATDGTHRTLLCIQEEWKVELPTGEVQAARKQLPLILAWALSIHKAQGQTLERVKVDLGKVFEKGQAYVALSRATRAAGLQVLRFDKNKVMAHPRVIQFYNKLYSAESAVKGKKLADISEFAHRGREAAAPAPVKRKEVPEVIDLDEEEEEAAAAMMAY